ncbi:hypothetical protein K505DRAFT_135315 [Melanomma pulvis-pyrius CBS 109.77]|uniref:Uncharacterized protein n=1 Tax=Melanomma pulvis-pyrius CBS 109.77 TaxID=1314802 RepID=A0A6A6WT55_9PLEO|nr:hypothetical protein K505DRAFT_135315 [Melanomma pulvis-pyrius CBS 109.77]
MPTPTTHDLSLLGLPKSHPTPKHPLSISTPPAPHPSAADASSHASNYDAPDVISHTVVRQASIDPPQSASLLYFGPPPLCYSWEMRARRHGLALLDLLPG